MKINQLNEAFDRVYGIPSEKRSVNESKKLNEDVSPAVKDLTDALFTKCRELQNRYETNIKVYEAEFQNVIEGQFPENAWWEVTDCNIFWSLFNDRDPQKTVIDIVDGIKPEFKAEAEAEAEEDIEEPTFIDNRRRSIISGDPFDDPGFDEYDIIGESIEKFLSKLDEKEMSDEDRRDTELIKSIYNKIQRRSNARLTPEEKAVLDKYGITRHNYSLAVGSGSDAYLDRNNLVTKKGSTNVDNDKVNFADRARKLAGRTERDITTRDEYGGARTMVRNRNVKKYQKLPDGKKGYYMGDVRADQYDRQAAEAGFVEDPVNVRHKDLKNALRDRRYHTAELGKVDSDYDDRVAKAKAAYDKALKDAESRRDFSRPYHSNAVNKSQSAIDKILKRK